MSQMYEKAILENRELWDVQSDNQGQIVVYTGLFIQKNGGVEETPDKEWRDDY